MSNISDAYDFFLARIKVVLPTHTEMPNPYKVDENNENFLKKGFGLAMGSGENTTITLNNRRTFARNFIVPISRIVRGIESNVTAKQLVQKQLYEDQFLLIQDFELDTTLNESAAVFSTSYAGDDGIQFVFGEKDNFLLLETTFSIEYKEDL